MRSVLAVFFLAAVANAADEAPAAAAASAAVEHPPEVIYRRLIPADVLRDFPGLCFASTKCSTIEPGQSWSLAPFCGRSTCVTAEKAAPTDPERLLELVEDCGPLPKENPKCKLSAKTNATADFPACCPIFECEPGVKLEYPEIPVIPPADAKKEDKKN